MAISVSVSYAINKITKSGNNLEVLYTLTNTSAITQTIYFGVYGAKGGSSIGSESKSSPTELILITLGGNGSERSMRMTISIGRFAVSE